VLVGIPLEERDHFKESLGHYIRKYRQQKGLTIEETAEEADTGMDHLGRIERGEKLPTAYTFAKLCDAIDMDPHVILEILNELKKYRLD